MHLAILMTNTDESDFAQAHPKDGEVFEKLVHLVRPEWTVEVFSVKDGLFPDDISRFDGAMITGSPASARDSDEWIGRLFALIRDMHARRQPVFGACFGHQAIAVALGGQLGFNPDGWVHGVTRNSLLLRPEWAQDLPDVVNLYGCHQEQVTQLPPGACSMTKSDACESSGFFIGSHVYATQQHPEMQRDFVVALTDELRPVIGQTLCDQALASLSEPVHQREFAESVARFFEQAHSSENRTKP